MKFFKADKITINEFYRFMKGKDEEAKCNSKILRCYITFDHTNSKQP